MAVDEQDVAGEDHAVFRNVDQDVAAGVRRAYFDDAYSLVADLALQLTLEGKRRHRDIDTVEIEWFQDAREKFAGLAELGRVALERVAQLQPAAVGDQFCSAGLRSDDLGAGDKLITEAMVAVGMRVDQRAETRRRLRLRAAHRVDHRARQLQVEQRIDEHGLAAVNDQTRVAPSPRSVGLQPRVASVAEIVQTLGVLPIASRHVSRSYRLARRLHEPGAENSEP